MSVTRIDNSPDPHLSSPEDPPVHPLVVVAFAVSVATAVGLLAGWTAAADVLLAILALFSHPHRGSDK